MLSHFSVLLYTLYLPFWLCFHVLLFRSFFGREPPPETRSKKTLNHHSINHKRIARKTVLGPGEKCFLEFVTEIVQLIDLDLLPGRLELCFNFWDVQSELREAFD